MTGIIAFMRSLFKMSHSTPPPPPVQPLTDDERRVIEARDRVAKARIELLRLEAEVPSLWQVERRSKRR
jgi:hypothetical protein